MILSVHVRSHLTFIVAPAATGRQAARWGGSQRSSVARYGTIFQVPLQPRQLHAAKPDLACRPGPACLPRLEHQTRLRSAQVHPPPPLTCCVLMQVVFPAGIHLHEHAGVAGWRAQVGAGLLGGAGASVTAVCAGVTVAAAGGCLGGVYGGVDPPWLGWWACRWASGFFAYLLLIETWGVM